MKATGIVRRIDELGRVVIPKEIRRTQRIRRGDPLEIFTTGDGEVIFKKYSPMGEVNTLAAQLAEVLSRQFALTAFVCDRDRILTVSGSGRRELTDRSISQPLEKLMDARKPYQSPGNPEKTPLPREGAPRGVLFAAPGLAGGGGTRAGGPLTPGPAAPPEGAPSTAAPARAAVTPGTTWISTSGKWGASSSTGPAMPYTPASPLHTRAVVRPDRARSSAARQRSISWVMGVEKHSLSGNSPRIRSR